MACSSSYQKSLVFALYYRSREVSAFHFWRSVSPHCVSCLKTHLRRLTPRQRPFSRLRQCGVMSAEPDALQAPSDATPEQPDNVVVNNCTSPAECACLTASPALHADHLTACLQRAKGAEFVLPIVIGTCAFYLGKKVRSFSVLRCLQTLLLLE